MDKKYNKILLKLINEWFENRKTLLDYDFVMLCNLANTTLNGNYGVKEVCDLNQKKQEVEKWD